MSCDGSAANLSVLPVDTIVAFACALALAAWITIRKPIYGITALLIAEPFESAVDIGPTQLSLPKVVLLGIVLGLAFRRPSLIRLRSPSVAPMCAGAIAIVFVTAATIVPTLYIDATIREILKSLEYLGVFVASALAVESEIDESWIAATLAAVSSVVCLLAIGDLRSSVASGILIGGQTIVRVAGPLEGPNQLAGYLDLVIPMLLAQSLTLRRNGKWFGLAAALAAITDLLTLSRAGLSAALLGAIVVSIVARSAYGWRLRRTAVVTGSVLGAIALALALRFGFVTRFITVSDVQRENGLGTRSMLWASAISLWKRDPGLGIGAGNFELRLPEVGLIGVRTHANSLYLQSLAEGGIALFAAVVWTFATTIVSTLRFASRSSLSLGVGAATCAFAYHQLFDDVLFFPKVGVLFWILAGSAVGRIAAIERAA